MSIEELEDKIIVWAWDRGIMSESTRMKQIAKSYEEVCEATLAIANNDPDGVRDGIGDVVVTLIIQARMWRLDLEMCLATAWDQIKDRQGKMIDGKFVKDG